jgi:hypothetical protein
MRRIVATEKLQEPNLQSQGEFSRAAKISKIELVRHCSILSRHLCADSKTYTFFPGHFRDEKLC